jgi:hypothetical protein
MALLLTSVGYQTLINAKIQVYRELNVIRRVGQVITLPNYCSRAAKIEIQSGGNVVIRLSASVACLTR